LTAEATDDLTVPPLFFTNQGYRVVSTEILKPTELEKKEFGLVQKSVTRIRSIAQVPLKDTHGKPDWYYRFTIIVEKYAAPDQAKKRLPLIDTPPHGNPHAEPDKAFPLRKGFQHGDKVYIIATDVAMYYFDGPLDKIKKAIEEQVAKETQAAGDKAQVHKVAVLYSEKFLLHDTGKGHPENSDRLKDVVAHLKGDKDLSAVLVWPEFKQATIECLETVHSADYLKLVEKEIKAIGKQGIAGLSTGDTVISPGTWEASTLAAGAGIVGCEEVMSGRASSAFALIRPPGHHASRERGMGFCVFNNAAVAARYLQKHKGIKRVLIADFDAHHGNGTQDIFYEDDSVFFFSIHQHPFYPGTGRPAETGKGKGLGFTLNVDLPAGSGDDAALAAFRDTLKPAMEKFKPEFILVSAGFDGHEGDPLGGLKYTDDGYASIAKELLGIANRYASGRIVFLLEGGYGPQNITGSVNSIITVLKNAQLPVTSN